MSRRLLSLANPQVRSRAHTWIDEAETGTRLTFQEPKRTSDQNARMWAMLTDIAQQVKYHGVTLSTNDFKLLFLDALKQEMRLVPNLSNTGFVSLGRSSSDLAKAEMSDVIELLFAWGAEHGVVFHEPEPIR